MENDNFLYVLDGHKAVPCPDTENWFKRLRSDDRHVADETIDDVRISTVFIGYDYSFNPEVPLLFETMIFGGEHHGDLIRCSTWEQAEAQHTEAVALVKQGNLQRN